MSERHATDRIRLAKPCSCGTETALRSQSWHNGFLVANVWVCPLCGSIHYEWGKDSGMTMPRDPAQKPQMVEQLADGMTVDEATKPTTAPDVDAGGGPPATDRPAPTAPPECGSDLPAPTSPEAPKPTPRKGPTQMGLF